MWKATILCSHVEAWSQKLVEEVALAAFGLIEGCTYKKDECPEYSVLEQHDGYEIRSYPSITWASTSETHRYRRIGQYKAFMRLFQYISGQNDREQKMEMTVPVRMRITKSGNETVFDMDFMVPSEFAENTPVPNDDKVKIVREPPTQYAVRTFKGYIWRQNTWVEEAEKLADLLKDDDTVIKTNYYQVGYDAPFDFFDRRNEIWMVKKVNEV